MKTKIIVPVEILEGIPNNRKWEESELELKIWFYIQNEIDFSPFSLHLESGFSRNKINKMLQKKTLKGHYERHLISMQDKASQEKKDSKKDTKRTLHKMQVYVKENYKNVSRMSQQLTREECNKLLSRFKKEDIIKKLEAMENKKDLAKKYVSVYKTLVNWLSMNGESDVDKIQQEADSLLRYAKSSVYPLTREGLESFIMNSKKSDEVKKYCLNKI